MLFLQHHVATTRARLARIQRAITKPVPYSTEWLAARGLFVMGRHSYTTPRIHYYAGDTCRVEVGDWSALAAEVEILPGGNHRLDTVASFPIERRLGLPGYTANPDTWSKGDVIIGSDVWIGRGVRILGGVTIGHGAVIAAWSTVTKDIEPYSIAAGVPAKQLRKRFDEPTIHALLRIAWWDWPENLIRARSTELASPDLLRFIARYDPGEP
jgi:acetyltransferase-like isoleucine patch superfamily enzyme